MNVLTQFDPWHSPLCTCPPKLTLNPYTGCDHGCLYCYASSYVAKFSNCRPKKNLIQRLTHEATALKGELISIANSSDPYPNLEAKTELTRKCIEILSNHDCKIQIVTKSDIVARDIDLLEKTRSMLALTITTDDDNIAKTLEPHAPAPSKRIKTVERLVHNGVPLTVRIDPIIPFVNDHPEDLIAKLASLGVKHITSSTYKVRPDNWKRMSAAMPQVAERLKPLYFQKGERTADYLYLPHETRLGLMKTIRSLAEEYAMKFGTCREGLSSMNTAICDGSWVIPEKTSKIQNR